MGTSSFQRKIQGTVNPVQVDDFPLQGLVNTDCTVSERKEAVHLSR